MNPADRMKRSHMPVVGVLGAVASGKSTVARLMAEEGGELVDADEIGHEVLQLPETERRLREEFGDEVLAPNGTVSREALGRLVFGCRERLEKLNAIVHPHILDIIERRIRHASEAGEAAFVVLDAALLMEKGLHERWCEALVFVDAEESARLERALGHRGWNADELLRRDAAQMPLDAKKRHADFVIDNSGTQKQLEETVHGLMVQIWEKLSLSVHQGRRAPASPGGSTRCGEL